MASPYTAGGIPEYADLVVGSVFIAVFSIIGLGLHLRSWYTYGYQFFWSLLCFIFCVARVLAIGLRIALKDDLTNKALACTGQIVLSAGVAFLFVVNLQMSRRFFGQLHPQYSAPVKHILTSLCYFVDPMVLLVVIAIIQTYAVSDPDIISIDRKLRIFASVAFTLLAFIPVVVVAFVLVLDGPRTSPSAIAEEKGVVNEKGNVDESAISTVQNSRATSFDVTAVDHHALQPEEKVEAENVGAKNLHIPKTGYGPAPPTRRELLKNAAAIVVPALLLTIEQGIRVAQVYYLPTRGEEPPWYMSKAAFWTVIFGLESITIAILGVVTLPKRFTHLKAVTSRLLTVRDPV